MQLVFNHFLQLLIYNCLYSWKQFLVEQLTVQGSWIEIFFENGQCLQFSHTSAWVYNLIWIFVGNKWNEVTGRLGSDLNPLACLEGGAISKTHIQLASRIFQELTFLETKNFNCRRLCCCVSSLPPKWTTCWPYRKNKIWRALNLICGRGTSLISSFLPYLMKHMLTVRLRRWYQDGNSLSDLRQKNVQNDPRLVFNQSLVRLITGQINYWS